jgi:hypothetical protein
VAFVACAAEVQHAREEVVPAGHHADLLFEAELGEQLTSDGVDLRIGERLAGLEVPDAPGCSLLDGRTASTLTVGDAMSASVCRLPCRQSDLIDPDRRP